VNRRARQNKTPKQARSSLEGPSTDGRLWNVTSQTWPAFNNTLKKDNNIHRFIQTSELGTVLTGSSSINVAYARSFTFSDVTQASSFSAIFDQYRITQIEIWFSPGMQAPGSTGAGGVSADIYSVVDYDDDTTPSVSSASALLQYTNLQKGPFNNGHYVKFRPHVAEALYGGAFTAFGNKVSPWIDMASPGVKHYGFKAFVSTAASSAVVLPYELTFRMHFECRNVY